MTSHLAFALAAIVSFAAAHQAVPQPNFAGRWEIDRTGSSSVGGGRGQVDMAGGGRGGGLGLGVSADALVISQDNRALTMEERRGTERARVVYRVDGSRTEVTLAAGRNQGTKTTAVSRWQDARLVTTITLPASAVGGAVTYEETRWLEKDGTMIVEIRRPGAENFRRTVYRPVK